MLFNIVEKHGKDDFLYGQYKIILFYYTNRQIKATPCAKKKLFSESLIKKTPKIKRQFVSLSFPI